MMMFWHRTWKCKRYRPENRDELESQEADSKNSRYCRYLCTAPLVQLHSRDDVLRDRYGVLGILGKSMQQLHEQTGHFQT